MGIYFSGHVVMKVIRLLHKFTFSPPHEIQNSRKNMEMQQNDNNSNKHHEPQDVCNTIHIPMSIEVTTHNDAFPKTSEFVAKAKNHKYNITRAAARRMVIFTIAYVTVNVGVSFRTILSLMVNKPLNLQTGVSDFVSASIGIAVFLVFKIT